MMDDVTGDSSTSTKNDKPVIVRVKRKAHQSPLEALWLEINERPLKKPFLDFEKLSISDSAAKAEEVTTKKIFVRRVETVSSSKLCSDALQSYIHREFGDGSESKRKIQEQRHNLKTESKQNKSLLKAKQKQDVLSKNARFEQIWRSRKEKKEVLDNDDGLHDMCCVYDIIRVDVDETSKEPQNQEDDELEDQRIMASYLPLLREFIPSAAADVESDIHDYVSKRGFKDDYVYDLYTVKSDTNMEEEDASSLFPLVQVNEEDEFYDGPDEPEYDSDDSNAEGNPLNEYPDEESSEEDDGDDSGSRTTKDESEEDSDSSGGEYSSGSSKNHHKRSRKVDPLYDGDFHCDDDNECDSDACNLDDDDDDDDEVDMIWSYR